MGGANGISLNMAKQNFQLFGAIKKELIPYVRKPLEEETS
ncbi:cysteine-rich CPCC family protein [Acinetobacter sp. 1179249]|nr:cysteine-rich CPCC family protein [Acinetobacter sp. 1179249]